MQDHLGLMWYAVDGAGLCCDDGYHVVTIQGDEQQPELLKKAHITALVEDKQNRIWIGTDNGCYVFSRHDKSIHLVEATRSKAITYLFTRSDGEIFVGASHILFQFKDTEEAVFTYDLENDNGKLLLASIAESDNFSIMLALSGGGLYLLGNEGGRLSTLNWPYAKEKDPTCVVADPRNQCWWIGTNGVGLVRYKDDYERLFSSEDEEGPHGPMDEVVHLSLDSPCNILWVTTREDLYAYQYEEDSLYAFDLSSIDASLRQKAPRTMTDKAGACWLYGDSIDISLIAITGIARTESTDPPRISFFSSEGIDYFAEKSDTLNIPPGIEEVMIYLSAFDFLHTANIQYAYRLSEKSEWTTLPKGKNCIRLTLENDENFILQVRATNAQGKWSKPATYAVTRHKSTETSNIKQLFLVIVIVLLCIGAFFYFRYVKRAPSSGSGAVKPAAPVTPVKSQQTEETHPEPDEETNPESESPTGLSTKEFARLVKEAVRKHLGEPEFGVDELSGALMMSRINFYRRFENIMGEKPMAYIRNARLALAARLLNGTNLTIVEISIRVGFSSPRYFSKCFREKYGVLPTEYRNRKNNSSTE